ncbi:alpha/beta fold hydrolase [Streptomyces sp. PRh5]|uniref:thioesterase II family protein n=1 Tax=Streptomyces sp. PRh5 TaxID=1158056 RepID=UPI00321FB512
MVCFPHAGASAPFFLPMTRALAPTVDVLAVQYPGRQDRRAEPRIEDIPTLADHIAHALTGSLDRPLSLFGHSMGAVLAFEVARRLQRDHPGQPAHLFVSVRRAPTRMREETHHLLDDEGIIAEIRSRRGPQTRAMENPEVRETVLPTLRGDYAAVGRYRYIAGDPLHCPVTALVGDREASVEEVRDWEEQALEGGFAFRVFPGGHFYLVKEIAGVVSVVSNRLAPAAGTGPRR